MNRLIALGLLTIFLRPQEDASIVDVSSVPELKALNIERVETADSGLPKSVSRYASLFTPKPIFGWDSKHDFTAQYKRLYPYPEMRYIPLKPFNPLQKEPGIQRVEGFQRQWKRTETGYDVTENTLWQWAPPKSFQGDWVFDTHHASNDHFMAVALLPLIWKLHNPILCYFDAEKGFSWHGRKYHYKHCMIQLRTECLSRRLNGKASGQTVTKRTLRLAKMVLEL